MVEHLDLRSFPTRRSSDLARPCCSTDPESPLAFRGPAAFSLIELSSSSLMAFPVIVARYWLPIDRKSTRLNSSHVRISYAVFCLKKKKDNVVPQVLWSTVL